MSLILPTQQLGRYHIVIQLLRAAIFIMFILLALMVHLGNKDFFSWSIYLQFYSIPTIALVLILVQTAFLEKFYSSLSLVAWALVLDCVLSAVLQTFSQFQSSIFIFIFFLQILLASVVAGFKTSLIVAAFASLSTTLNLILGPDLKTATLYYQIILYNFSFYIISWFGGLVSEQLQVMGLNLQFMRRLNESIIETIPSGLVTVDQKGDIVSWNPAFGKILGYQPDQYKNIKEIFPDWSFELNTHEPIYRKFEIPLKTDSDNKILFAQIMPHQTDKYHHLILFEDITEKQRLELQIRHQEKLAAVGGLASGIAHELGNPLAAVSANIQFLEPKIKIEDETDRKLLSNTHKEIARLGRLISEFKDFAKPEKVPVDPVFLHQILAEVIDLAGKEQKREVKIVTLVNQVPPIHGSKDKLTQVFLNLLINAYHAVEDAVNPEIQVVCVVRGEQVEVRIKDNGVGMSEETKIRLFEPFYTTKGRKGTGLGLAISHKILEAHKAEVQVISEKGKGTEFIIHFMGQSTPESSGNR